MLRTQNYSIHRDGLAFTLLGSIFSHDVLFHTLNAYTGLISPPVPPPVLVDSLTVPLGEDRFVVNGWDPYSVLVLFPITSDTVTPSMSSLSLSIFYNVDELCDLSKMDLS
jgi:hypothetical protein